MDASWFMAIILFASIMSLTPGPNNIVLLASGAQVGYRQSLPYIVGVLIGVSGLYIAILLGLGAVLNEYPELNNLLKLIGSLYLFWLAWKITTAETETDLLQGPVEKTANNEARISFINAATFQLINPKSWAFSIGSISSFTISGEHYIESGLWIMFCFVVTGFFSMSLWTYSGLQIATLLTTVKRKKVFNHVMGAMTVCTLFFILN